MAGQSIADADPRVGLAEDRTHMANLRTSRALDRTMLAWLRANLTMATLRRLRQHETPVLTNWSLSVMVGFMVAPGGLVGLRSVSSR